MEVEGYEKYSDFFSEYSAVFHHGKIISALPYMIEAVTDALADLYDMKYCDKGRWWYGEWEGDRRKVVTLGSPKGTCRNICWGWNYNYIPRKANTGKFTYARTEKSFRIDIGDEYLFHLDYHPDNTTCYDSLYMEYNYELPKDTNNIEEARKHMKIVCERNIPFIKDYFDSTPDDETTLAEAERRRKEKPWLFTFSRVGWTRAFMFAKQGRLEEAKYIISHEYYSDGYCPEDVLQKLCLVAENV